MVWLHQRLRPAFTLAEILTVVTIIGIAAAVILPQLGSRDDLKAATAARIVMADLIYAQNHAITTQQPHYIVFQNLGPSASYGIATTPAPAADTDYVLQPVNQIKYVQTFGPGGTPGLDQVALTSASFNGNKTTLAFDPLGSPWAYGATADTGLELTSGWVQLTCGSKSLWIVIGPFTGEITIQETSPD